MTARRKFSVVEGGVHASMSAVGFLKAMTAPDVYGTVVAIDPSKERGDAGHISGCSYTVEALDEVSAFIDAHSQHNLYWSPNPTHSPIDKKPLKTDIAQMRWVHLDLDDPSDAALRRVRDYPLPPTAIVASGGGYNVYWSLADPVEVGGKDHIKELEDANRRVILDLGADTGTQNLDRILRLPGTTNYPTKAKLRRGRVPVPAVLIEYHLERTYRLQQFAPPRTTRIAIGIAATRRRRRTGQGICCARSRLISDWACPTRTY